MGDRPHYSSDEVAAMLEISPQHVSYLARRFKVGTKFGRSWMFTWADVQAIDSRKKRRGPPQKEGN